MNAREKYDLALAEHQTECKRTRKACIATFASSALSLLLGALEAPDWIRAVAMVAVISSTVVMVAYLVREERAWGRFKAAHQEVMDEIADEVARTTTPN